MIVGLFHPKSPECTMEEQWTRLKGGVGRLVVLSIEEGGKEQLHKRGGTPVMGIKQIDDDQKYMLCRSYKSARPSLEGGTCFNKLGGGGT